MRIIYYSTGIRKQKTAGRRPGSGAGHSGATSRATDICHSIFPRMLFILFKKGVQQRHFLRAPGGGMGGRVR